MSLTILYPYKNKDLIRLEKSLKSLETQTNQDFKILLVDYGSDLDIRDKNIQKLKKYQKLTYLYTYHINQPWSRPRAINIGVKNIDTDYVFVADIDMIFRDNFVELLHNLKNPNKSFYFKVGYLSQEDSKKRIAFDKYSPMHFSNKEAQGISLFPVKELFKINGLDEYIHFWGADNDIHNRLMNNGLEAVFFDKEVLILHQWHIIYANENKNILTTKPQLPYISKINQKLQTFNQKNKITKTNLKDNWGKIISENQYKQLNKSKNTIEISCKEEDVLFFIYNMLPNYIGVLNVTFKFNKEIKKVKYIAKKILGKKVFKYLTLKEINNLLLLHLISFYKDYPYEYIISEDLKSINLKILKL